MPPLHGQARPGAAAKRPARKSYSETERRRRAVADHRARVGDWCPGAPGHPAHPSADLVADHLFEVAAGGLESGRCARALPLREQPKVRES
jgi:hypothetical protein